MKWRLFFVPLTMVISLVTTSTPLVAATSYGPVDACGVSAAPHCLAWRIGDLWAGHHAAVELLTFVPTHQSVRANAAWIRTSSTDLALYLGYRGPGPSAVSRGPEMVPVAARSSLLATFNSGFYESDGEGGFFTHGTLYYPLRPGLATLVRYRDGTVGIVSWRGGASPGPSVLMARQNLPLLVDGSRATSGAANNAAWGLTLHGAAAVWRSALGIDAHGNLVYAAAPAQTALTLAAIMVQLHCVRAMELDINPEWPIFVTYGGPGAALPTLDVANPNQIAGRFLYPSTKDFFAVFVRARADQPTPW